LVLVGHRLRRTALGVAHERDHGNARRREGGVSRHLGHHGRARGLAVPFGYYDDSYSGDYDPSTVTPDEQPAYPARAYPDVQPAYPTTASPDVQPPRSSCSTQTYKVPSEDGGETSINVVRC